jgi:hypothetical protein
MMGKRFRLNLKPNIPVFQYSSSQPSNIPERMDRTTMSQNQLLGSVFKKVLTREFFWSKTDPVSTGLYHPKRETRWWVRAAVENDSGKSILRLIEPTRRSF